LKIFYIFIYFSNEDFLWKRGRKDIGGCSKGPKKKSSDTTRAAQKDIVGAKNINVLVAEN